MTLVGITESYNASLNYVPSQLCTICKIHDILVKMYSDYSCNSSDINLVICVI